MSDVSCRDMEAKSSPPMKMMPKMSRYIGFMLNTVPVWVAGGGDVGVGVGVGVGDGLFKLPAATAPAAAAAELPAAACCDPPSCDAVTD